MSAPTAIRATFSEWKMVKTRKVLQLIFEFPLEKQAEVLAILGAPMPDAEIWCGIARLDLSKPLAHSTPEAGSHEDERIRSERAKAAYAQASPGEQAVTRAALLADDPRFQAWAIGGAQNGPDSSAQFIRDRCCRGGSRKLIAEDLGFFHAFLALEVDYKIWAGQIAEPR